MAWTFDAANTGVNENDTNAIVTFSHTVGTLTNGILFVWAAWATTGTTITGITYNGVAMTQAVVQAANRACALFYLVAPASGAHDVVISGSGNFGRISAGSHSWDGANSTQTPTTQTGSGTSANPSITVTTASGELVVDCIGISFTAGDTLTVDANQTERGKISGGATMGASSTQNGVDGGVMSWTDSNSRAYGMVAASFDPAGGQTIAVGQTTETDTSQAIARSKQKAIGQNAETDLTQAINRQKQYSVLFVSETDSVQSVAIQKIKTMGQIEETNTAQSIAVVKQITVNQVIETNTAQPITEGGALVVAVGQVEEIDAAQSITIQKIIVVSQVSETDLVQSLFPAKQVAVLQVIETDFAQSITSTGPITIILGIATETDSAFAIIVPILSTIVALHLHARDLDLSLVARDRDLSLYTHTTELTLENLQ